MEFAITRTSMSEKPCEEAYKKDLNDKNFYIEIESLDALLSLLEKVGGRLIIDEDGGIEIYDDYRE